MKSNLVAPDFRQLCQKLKIFIFLIFDIYIYHENSLFYKFTLKKIIDSKSFKEIFIEKNELLFKLILNHFNLAIKTFMTFF